MKSKTWWRRIWGVILGAWLLVGVVILDPLELSEFLGTSSTPGRRAVCVNNIRQLGMALINYHGVHGSLPPAYTVDAEGQPLHSWRTLLLPFLDRNDIYQSLRLDEPWDSPHNCQFADLASFIMCCPTEDLAKGWQQSMTSYVVVVGPETAFPGSETVSLDDISDGPANTLLIVEVTNSGIHWMEPRDLHVTQMAPTVNTTAGQGIRGEHSDGAVVAFADGHVASLSDAITAEELDALLTIAGGEETPKDAY